MVVITLGLEKTKPGHSLQQMVEPATPRLQKSKRSCWYREGVAGTSYGKLSINLHNSLREALRYYSPENEDVHLQAMQASDCSSR